MNPNYYQLESVDGNAINDYLSELIEKTCVELGRSGTDDLNHINMILQVKVILAALIFHKFCDFYLLKA